MDLLKAALTVVFIYAMFQPGNLLGIIPQILWAFPWWVKKPIFKCLTCMSSCWGTGTYFLFSKNYELLEYIQFIFPLAGILYIIDCLLTFNSSLLNDEIEG